MRIVKTVLIYTTIIAVSLLSILVVFGFIFQDKVINSVSNEINQSLNSEIKVDALDFSFLTHFPKASVSLNHITGFESSNYAAVGDTLFHFEELALSFSILDIIQGKYILNSISVTDGYVNLEIDQAGQENYLFIKSDSSDTANFFLNLEEVILKNCEVKFRDFRTENQYAFDFPFLEANGTFSSTQITTALFGQTKVNKLVLENTPYLTNESGQIDIGVKFDLEKGIFQVSRGFINLRNKYQFEVVGHSSSSKYDYTFTAEKLDLDQAEPLIPRKHITFIDGYLLNGRADLSVNIKKGSKDKHPQINGGFNITNGSFNMKKSELKVGINVLKGRFDLGKLASSSSTQIWVDQFDIRTKEGEAKGTFSLSNLNKPWYKLKSKGKVDLIPFSEFLDLKNGFSMSGAADFDFQISGVIHDLDSLTEADIKSMKGEATIHLLKAGFVIPNVPSIDSVSSTVRLSQEMVVLEKFNGIIAGSKTKGTVKAENWIKYIINSESTLRLFAQLHTHSIETNDWLMGAKEDSEKEFSFPDFITLQGHLEAESLHHTNTYITNLSADIKYVPRTLTLTKTRFNSFSGDLGVNLVMRQNKSSFSYDVNLQTKNVNLQKMLEAYSNFGQTAVTDTHIRGVLNCGLDISFESNNDFEINNSSIIAAGDFMILNGEMIENKLLYQIPSEIESNTVIGLFINLEAFEKKLHHIKFDTISNHLTIENGRVVIPKMHISSSALQIDIAGVHSFSNEMDYYLSFNLNEVLTKKRKNNNEYGYIQDDKLGNRMMFLHMYTKNGEVQVDLDKDGARKYRETKQNEEVDKAKTVLKNEFGLFKNDTSIVVTEEELKFEYEIDLGEFADDSISSSGNDSTKAKADSTILGKNSKKKKSKKDSEDVDDWDFDDDY